MKKSILTLFLLSIMAIVLCGSTSEPPKDENGRTVFNHFTIEENSVIWSNVYQFLPEQEADIRKFLTSLATSDEEDATYYQTPQMLLPIKESGQNPTLVVMILTRPCVIKYMIQFKEGRYKVIVTDITWDPQISVFGGGNGLGANVSVGLMGLYDLAFNGKRIKNTFYRTSSAQLDKALDCFFKYKTTTNDDNW